MSYCYLVTTYQIYGRDFANFCGLLRIYELYHFWPSWLIWRLLEALASAQFGTPQCSVIWWPWFSANKLYLYKYAIVQFKSWMASNHCVSLSISGWSFGGKFQYCYRHKWWPASEACELWFKFANEVSGCQLDDVAIPQAFSKVASILKISGKVEII